MKRHLAGLVCMTLVLVILTPPDPASAWGSNDSIPSWVPITIVASVVAGGVLYLRHKHHQAQQKPRTDQERAQDLVCYIATSDEMNQLSTLTERDDINAFIKNFFERRDPNPHTDENEFREEYLRRYAEASRRYGHGGGPAKSDRRRIYMTQGPPRSMVTYQVRQHPDHRILWKSVEIWQYEAVSGSNPFPLILSDPDFFDVVFAAPPPAKGMKTFLFINDTGEGNPRLGFSTEATEVFDRSIYSLSPKVP